MLLRLILKITKFQFPPPKRFSTVVRNIWGGGHHDLPPCQIGLKDKGEGHFKYLSGFLQKIKKRVKIFRQNFSYSYSVSKDICKYKNSCLPPWILGLENPKERSTFDLQIEFFTFSLKSVLRCRKFEASKGFWYEGVGTDILF